MASRPTDPRLTATRESLLARLRDGGRDDDAWWEFDRRYRDLILSYARRQGLQQADAEDVRQLVMMSLARTLPGFRYDRAVGRFRHYLRVAVTNAIRNLHRRPTGDIFSLSPGDETAARDAGDDEIWEQEWMLHHYRLAMSTIRRTFQPKSLEVFDALLAGRPVDEAAAAHGMTPEAVYKVKHRIRDRLAELISEQVAEEDA